MLKKQSNQKGFTLIEVLIAAGMLTIILLSVYGTFFSVHRAIISTDNNMSTYREIRVFFDIIRREIESCYVNRADKNTFLDIKDRDQYGVQASELAFTAFVPYGAGLYSVAYSLDTEKKTLNKTVASLWEEGKLEKQEVLENVEAFKVQAFNHNQWTSTFHSSLSNGLAAALKVTITFNVQGETMTLEQTISPKIRG